MLIVLGGKRFITIFNPDAGIASESSADGITSAGRTTDRPLAAVVVVVDGVVVTAIYK